MLLAALEIPPGASYVRTVRLLAANVARQSGYDEDSVDDIRLAVSEACLLHLGHDDPIEVRFSADDLGLTVEVGPNATPSAAEPDSQLAMTVLRAVAPRLELTDGGLIMAWPTADA
ncbi:MAG: ATP-binding protein [Actinobacteria bacterium]|nr:ATP-binding protein [Actinomycetota bacterium]